jgi:hypothetical protein
VAVYGENSVFQYTTQIGTNPSANLVIGQDTFSLDDENLAPTTASSFSYPAFVAIDTSVVPTDYMLPTN